MSAAGNNFKGEKYFGGQRGNGHYQRIISMIPDCDVYIEPFLGYSGVINNLTMKPGLIVGLDLDAAVIDKWKQNLLPEMQVYNCDYSAVEILLSMSAGKRIVIHYDPPYRNTSSPKKYKFDLTEKDYHQFLNHVTMLANIDIMVSHWQDDLFDKYLLPSGFHHVAFQTISHRGLIDNGCYLNFNPAERKLLDYSYVGVDYTDRQRIKRKVDRNISKIMSLSAAERGLLIQELNQNK